MKAMIFVFVLFSIMIDCQHPDFIETHVTGLESRNICDYDITESALVAAGWTKRFDESFSGNLNQWNTWTGGAYNNELQYYQAPNLVVQNGALTINAHPSKYHRKYLAF